MPPNYDAISASPVQPAASADSEASWLNQTDIRVIKWHPEGENGLRMALVDYTGVNGLLKCTRNVDQHNNEVMALQKLQYNFHTLEVLFVPEILDIFQANDGYHCLILEVIKGYSLREYISMIPEYLRDAVTYKFATTLSSAIYFVHTSNFTHGNINPDTIYFRSNDRNDALELVLTGFEGSQSLTDLPQTSIVKPKDFTPPEDFIESKVDQRKRDAWMVGATLYFMTNGHPPYGFAYSKKHKAVLPVPTKELKETMVRVATIGDKLYAPIETKNTLLLHEMEWLLAPKPQNRHYAEKIALDGILDAIEYTPTNTALLKVWNKLKSKLPIIGTPRWQAEPPRLKGKDVSM
ncbi:kinase-like domain-containing protein [Thamnocephalis sphaerospora]|uniref:Kinase-like domain-containing protein n=1 Tax=Thamnocephalis sphaerospora TaxID=78915 RepID=A0A4V1IX53_9FUNG|nr:kinase-like domain-containing protein [Thamnocephalis sphaerospora]|eukprot:RKP09859.1 kinase-like domain-containing protein [Thamnocephalis sphaerospora]